MNNPNYSYFNMEYLNKFKPSSLFLDEISSLKEFSRNIEIETLIDTKLFESFDPDKIILKDEAVVIEFTDYKDEAVFKKFEVPNLYGLKNTGFTAVEMFYNIISFQEELDKLPCFFERIEFIEYKPLNGKSIPYYKVYFK